MIAFFLILFYYIYRQVNQSSFFEEQSCEADKELTLRRTESRCIREI